MVDATPARRRAGLLDVFARCLTMNEPATFSVTREAAKLGCRNALCPALQMQ